MKIVIDIPNGAYEELCGGQFPVQEAYRIVAWIKEGTPLPEGAEILTKEAYSDLCLRASKEQKVGKWIHLLNGSGNVECTECGVEQPIDSYYCPWCGANMEGAEE